MNSEIQHFKTKIKKIVINRKPHDVVSCTASKEIKVILVMLACSTSPFGIFKCPYKVAKHQGCVQNHKAALNAMVKTITKANINLNRN